MNPIFYKRKSNNECFKFVMEDSIPQKQIDACLDAIGFKDSEFITEDEFKNSYDKLMDIDVFDTTSTYKIGVLTTRWIDLDEVDEL